MPRICEFYGIVITMYHREEHFVPHFHASYQGEEAVVAIETLDVLEGKLPPRALRLVREWARAQRAPLLENWSRARRHLVLEPIPPLD